MNFIKEYILPALAILLVAAILMFGYQFLADASWAEGIRASAASTPPEVGPAPTNIILIGLPFAITSAVLKRTQKQK
ncbi:MAG: hypothetical protein IPG80_04220 [Anaerolineales bacterium]|uniref:hypothetical protein n=1 Tax=Candidatus Villigracilis vicinus TaxID=3140679 RepID=UPI00313732ED|nr:hypothetical protein [Anaerolineales bacterium]